MGRRDLKIGFKASLDFYKMEVEQVCDVLAGIGYKGVEWDIPHFDPQVTTAEQRKKLSEVPRRCGMETIEVMIQDDYITRDEDERNRRTEHTMECVRAAAEAGIGMVNVFTGPRFWDEGNPRLHRDIQEGDAWNMVMDAYEKIVPVAEECRVILALEICNGMVCRDFYTCNHLLDHINSDYLCINMDPSHHHLARNDIPWVIRQWGPKITHVHLKDAIGNPGFQDETFVYPLPGDGVIDWNTVFDALEEVEYNGYYTVEYEAFHYYRKILKEDPVKAAEVSYRQIMALLEDD